jgi:ParB family chromosome partitioning protein
MSAAQIAKRTKIKRDTVNTALAVAKSDLAKAANDRYDFLTLEQAAAVAEFDDDPDTVKELITTAQKGYGFDHCLQRLRNKREERVAKQPIIDELVAAGVTVIDRPRWTDPTKPLEQLGTDDDPLTPQAHASCAGHIAWIDEEWTELPQEEGSDDGADEGYEELTYVAIYGCSDPVAYGHAEPTAVAVRNGRHSAQVSDEEAKAERRRVLRNNKAWRAAETVRREWLKTFVTRKSAPKGSLRYILSELATGGYQLRDAMEKHHRFACELLGIDDVYALTATLNEAGDARANDHIGAGSRSTRGRLGCTHVAESKRLRRPVPVADHCMGI